MERIYITGIGHISAAGADRQEVLRALLTGRSGIGPLDPEAGLPVKLAGRIAEFALSDYLESKKTYVDRCSSLALAASAMALEEAAADPKAEGWADQVGTSIGSDLGCMDSLEMFLGKMEASGPKFVNPTVFGHSYVNTPCSLVAMEWNLRGPHMTLSSGRVTGFQSLFFACDALQTGRARAMLAGGSESLSKTAFQGWLSLGKMSPGRAGKEEGCWPFDQKRNGWVLGEGAGILFLETGSSVKERGVQPQAEILGWGMAHSSCLRDGVQEAIQDALVRSETTADQLGWISASACSDPFLDAEEGKGIERALAGISVPVSSLVGLTGETRGALGGLHAGMAVMSLGAGQVPHTCLLEVPESGASLHWVMNAPEALTKDRILLTGLDPSGQACALVLGKSGKVGP